MRKVDQQILYSELCITRFILFSVNISSYAYTLINKN